MKIEIDVDRLVDAIGQVFIVGGTVFVTAASVFLLAMLLSWWSVLLWAAFFAVVSCVYHWRGRS